MDNRVHLHDRLRHSFATTSRRAAAAQIANLLSPRTPEELERRRAHLLALLLVAIPGVVNHVTGLTDGNAQYTVYVMVIAVAAVVGGVAPACVATLTAILLANADGGSNAGAGVRLLFAIGGLVVAWVVGAMSDRLRETSRNLRRQSVSRASSAGRCTAVTCCAMPSSNSRIWRIPHRSSP